LLSDARRVLCGYEFPGGTDLIAIFCDIPISFSLDISRAHFEESVAAAKTLKSMDALERAQSPIPTRKEWLAIT
jgi:hypothetical protein